MKVIGIDPGRNGGVAVIIDGVPRRTFAMPVSDGPLAIDVGGLHATLHECMPCDMIAIEHVHAFPGQGVVSMFTFGATFGATVAACTLTGVPITLVSPQSWKKALRLTKRDKREAAQWCLQQWPSARHLLFSSPRSKIPHSGIADSICIGYYVSMCFKDRHDHNKGTIRHAHSDDAAARRAGVRRMQRK